MKIDKTNSEVINLRTNAERLIMMVIREAFKQDISSRTTYKHLDEMIDSYEMIGLFSDGELRQKIIKRLEEGLR